MSAPESFEDLFFDLNKACPRALRKVIGAWEEEPNWIVSQAFWPIYDLVRCWLRSSAPLRQCFMEKGVSDINKMISIVLFGLWMACSSGIKPEKLNYDMIIGQLAIKEVLE